MNIFTDNQGFIEKPGSTHIWGVFHKKKQCMQSLVISCSDTKCQSNHQKCTREDVHKNTPNIHRAWLTEWTLLYDINRPKIYEQEKRNQDLINIF